MLCFFLHLDGNSLSREWILNNSSMTPFPNSCLSAKYAFSFYIAYMSDFSKCNLVCLSLELSILVAKLIEPLIFPLLWHSSICYSPKTACLRSCGWSCLSASHQHRTWLLGFSHPCLPGLTVSIKTLLVGPRIYYTISKCPMKCKGSGCSLFLCLGTTFSAVGNCLLKSLDINIC